MAADDITTSSEFLTSIDEYMNLYKDSHGFFQIGNSNYGIARKINNKTNGSNTVDIVTVGNVDAGKSTLTGCLITGKNDDGNGMTRKNVFNYPHEKESGRTSSISRTILGYDENNNSINVEYYNNSTKLACLNDWPNIIKASKHLVVLHDLCGHEKYLKTTITGVLGSQADYGIIVVSANSGLNKMAIEHISLLNSAEIPYIMVLTKIDIAPKDVYTNTLETIKRAIGGKLKKRNLLAIRTIEDIVTILTNPEIMATRYIPIIQVSSVTGKNIQLLRDIIGILPKRVILNNILDDCSIARITEKFMVKGVGTTALATIKSGTFAVNDKIFIGPYSTRVSKINGKLSYFKETSIKDIHMRRVPVKESNLGDSCTFLLRNITKDEITKNMILSSKPLDDMLVKRFTANICVLHHQTTITIGFQPMINVGNISQNAKIINIKNLKKNKDGEFIKSIELRTRDRAQIDFEFTYRPEFINIGNTIVIREGTMRAVGKIVKIID